MTQTQRIAAMNDCYDRATEYEATYWEEMGPRYADSDGLTDAQRDCSRRARWATHRGNRLYTAIVRHAHRRKGE